MKLNVICRVRMSSYVVLHVSVELCNVFVVFFSISVTITVFQGLSRALLNNCGPNLVGIKRYCWFPHPAASLALHYLE